MVSDPIDDAISAMLDAVFSVEEYKNYDVQRDALYWRLEDILTWWAAEGVDITALLKEFTRAQKSVSATSVSATKFFAAPGTMFALLARRPSWWPVLKIPCSSNIRLLERKNLFWPATNFLSHRDM